MGLRVRKSVKVGPVRVNLSKSGVGVSAGVKGARVTKTADGKTRTTVSVPGTGVSYVKETSSKPSKPEGAAPAGCMTSIVMVFAVILAVAILLSSCTSVEPSASQSPPAPSASEPAETEKAGTPLPSRPGTLPGDKATASPKPSADPAPSESVKPTPSAEPSPSPSASPSANPEPSPSVTPSVEPSPSPSVEPSPSAEPSPSPTPSAPPVSVGLTYIGNSNTMKFHEPSCSSVDDMKAENKVILSGRDAAIAGGYKPCGRCKP